MKPEIYAVKEGYKIHLAQAPIGDPKLRYRKEVERFASRGEISAIGRYTLNALRNSLGVLSQDADPIKRFIPSAIASISITGRTAIALSR